MKNPDTNKSLNIVGSSNTSNTLVPKDKSISPQMFSQMFSQIVSQYSSTEASTPKLQTSDDSHRFLQIVNNL